MARDTGYYYCTAFWEIDPATIIQASSNECHWSFNKIELEPAIGVKDSSTSLRCNIMTEKAPDLIVWLKEGNSLDSSLQQDSYQVFKNLYLS